MSGKFKTFVYGMPFVAVLFVCAVPVYGQQSTCTMEQLQLPAARECMRLLDQDVAKKDSNSKGHMLVCSISGIRCCISNGKGGFSECGPVLDTSKKEDDKKASDAKKKQEEVKRKEEAKKKEEEAKKKAEEAKKVTTQKVADPMAGLKFECVPDKDGSKYAIKVFLTNNSDIARTCTVECSYARSDKKSGATKCPDVRISAHSPRQLMCTDSGDKTGPGPYTNATAKAECR